MQFSWPMPPRECQDHTGHTSSLAQPLAVRLTHRRGDNFGDPMGHEAGTLVTDDDANILEHNLISCCTV